MRSGLAYPFSVILFAACPPAPLDPIVGDTGTSTGGPVTTGDPDPGLSTTSGATTTITTGVTDVDITTTQPTTLDELDDCASNFVFECDVPKPECDVWAQDCRPGEKCSPFAQPASENWGWSTRCVPVVPDPALSGEACVVQQETFVHGEGFSGIDDCDATSICWDFPDLNNAEAGTCRPRCTGGPGDPMCPDGSFCFAGELSDDPLVNVCLTGCDPLLGDCPATEICQPYFGQFVCRPDTSSDSLPAHAPCDDFPDCGPGLGCFDGALSGACEPGACCLPFCDLTIDPNPACSVDAGESCFALFETFDVPPELADVGLCGIPQ